MLFSFSKKLSVTIFGYINKSKSCVCACDKGNFLVKLTTN